MTGTVRRRGQNPRPHVRAVGPNGCESDGARTMTRPDDSDEWWRQYSGEGVSPSQPSQPVQQPGYQQPPSPYPAAQPYQPAPAPQPYGYGQPGYQPYPGYGQPAMGTNGLAIASLCTSFACCGIISIVLGFVALNQIKETGQSGRGLAIAGISIGAVGLLLGVLYFVFLFAVGVSSS